MYQQQAMQSAKAIVAFTKKYQPVAAKASGPVVAVNKLLKPMARALIAMSQQSRDGKGAQLYERHVECFLRYVEFQSLTLGAGVFGGELAALKFLVLQGVEYVEVTVQTQLLAANHKKAVQAETVKNLSAQRENFLSSLDATQLKFLSEFTKAGLTFSYRDFK